MKRHIFIINPEAGKKKGIQLIDFIKEQFKEPLIFVTLHKGHATELAKEHAKPNTIIYAIGGDGTLNEVVNGIAKSKYSDKTTVAVVPCGSGNDFIKGLTNIKDPIKLLKRYQKEKERVIDLGVLNGRFFINIASVGFDAQIVHNARKYKRIGMVNGEFAYFISIFMTIFILKDYSVYIRLDNQKQINKKILFMTMANSRYYGGGMQPAPTALLDDGRLEFCVVDKIPRWKVLLLLPKFIKGKHGTLKEVFMNSGKNLVIKSKQSMPINVDGEIIWHDNVHVQIKEKALKVLVP